MKRQKNAGFTLMELLVTLTIIALLVALLLPSLSRARTAAKVAVCASNLHQLGAAINTQRGDAALQGAASSATTLYGLQPYLSSPKVYVCPEDIPPTGDPSNVQIAVYYGQKPTNSPVPDTPAYFLYYMPIETSNVIPYCWVTKLPNGYIMNYEDTEVVNGGFYNCYIVATYAPGGLQLWAPRSIQPGDTPPPYSGLSTSIGEMYQYHLVDMAGNELITTLCPGQPGLDSSNIYRWMPGDPRKPVIQAMGCSYGMNILFPGSMGPKTGDSIVILDYQIPVVSLAGPNRITNEWYDEMQPSPPRPGLARHAGKFNALFGDGSVRTSLVPTVYDPTNNTAVQQQYWGGP